MDHAPQSVLLVDDDRTFLSTFAREFARRRWRVSTAQNGVEATPRARADRPAVIVLDLMLGEECALELIPGLRREAPGARIVILTGSASIATAVESIKLGADHYLEKPATVEQIIESVEHRGEPESLAQSERAHIERVLHESGGNVSEAARRLRMHRRTLQRKLRKSTPR
jgi:two-component system response regulator RegA